MVGIKPQLSKIEQRYPGYQTFAKATQDPFVCLGATAQTDADYMYEGPFGRVRMKMRKRATEPIALAKDCSHGTEQLQLSFGA
jgi:hypothetical protein